MPLNDVFYPGTATKWRILNCKKLWPSDIHLVAMQYLGKKSVHVTSSIFNSLRVFWLCQIFERRKFYILWVWWVALPSALFLSFSNRTNTLAFDKNCHWIFFKCSYIPMISSNSYLSFDQFLVHKGIVRIPSFAEEFPRKLRRGPLEAIFAGIRGRPPLPAFSSSEESESDSRRPPLHHKTDSLFN